MSESITKAPAVDEAALRRQGLRVMCYYGDRIVGTPAQIREFAAEGLEYCEGPEADRLCNILSALRRGDLILNDDPWGRPASGPLKTWAVFEAEADALDAMLSESLGL